MVPFKGYGRLTRSTTLALLTTVAILGAEWADLLPDNVMLAVRTGCQIYVLLRVMRARISPAYLLLWGPLAWFFPLPTALLIFVFGGRKHIALADAKKEVNRVAWRLSDEPDFGGNRFRLLGDRDGQSTLEELRRQIKSAKRRISLSTYILSDDAVGREIVSLLTARAKAGVEVRLLVDAIGSFGIPLRLCRPLRRARRRPRPHLRRGVRRRPRTRPSCSSPAVPAWRGRRGAACATPLHARWRRGAAPRARR